MNFPGLLGGFYQSFSPKAECEEAINVYTERIESGQGVNEWAMYRSPGLDAKYETAVSARVRGAFELNDHVFLIVEDTIYEILSDFSTHATYGPIANDGGKVYMAGNPDTLGIVSAGHFYRIFEATLAEPDINGFTPLNVAFGDNYWILMTSTQIVFTDDPSATVWDAADVQTAEADANFLLSMIWDHETLFLYGNRVTQAFLIGTDADAPFLPQKNGVITVGIAAAGTIVALDGKRYWIGQNKEGTGIVYQGEGYSFNRISTHAIENFIRDLGDISDAVAWPYQLNGHSCVRFIFPSGNTSLEYDTTSNNWSKPLYRNTTSGLDEMHRGYCAVAAFHKILVGDHSNGLLYEMSPDYYDDNGAPIHWKRIAPHLIEENFDIRYNRLDLGCQTGVGLDVASTVQGYDPQVRLRYSDDGGNTWSNELMRSMGRIGQYKKEVFWNRLGTGRDRVFELSGSDPVKVAITAAWFDAEVLK